MVLSTFMIKQNKQTPGLQSASELYQPSDRRLSAKLVPTVVGIRCADHATPSIR
jgi:hypothetical protein